MPLRFKSPQYIRPLKLSFFSANGNGEIKIFREAFKLYHDRQQTSLQSKRCRGVDEDYYCYVKKHKKVTGKEKTYRIAGKFENGYAMAVGLDNELYYIDQDQTVVILEEKIKTFQEMIYLLKVNPDGVYKYVSVNKLISLQEQEKQKLESERTLTDEGLIEQMISMRTSTEKACVCPIDEISIYQEMLRELNSPALENE